jgi:hypothetical protein
LKRALEQNKIVELGRKRLFSWLWNVIGKIYTLIFYLFTKTNCLNEFIIYKNKYMNINLNLEYTEMNWNFSIDSLLFSGEILSKENRMDK